jgi:hypothetical protein
VDVVSFFLSAAGAFGKLVGWLSNRRQSDRDALALYFEKISACLREVAERIEAGEAPRDTSRRLAVYALELDAVLRDRGFITVENGPSIDETSLRLRGLIVNAERIWAGVPHISDRAAIELGADELARQLVSYDHPWLKHPHQAEISEIAIDRVQGNLAYRASARKTTDVQPIWDAAGEFSALADTLRASI